MLLIEDAANEQLINETEAGQVNVAVGYFTTELFYMKQWQNKYQPLDFSRSKGTLWSSVKYMTDVRWLTNHFLPWRLSFQCSVISGLRLKLQRSRGQMGWDLADAQFFQRFRCERMIRNWSSEDYSLHFRV